MFDVRGIRKCDHIHEDDKLKMKGPSNIERLHLISVELGQMIKGGCWMGLMSQSGAQ